MRKISLNGVTAFVHSIRDNGQQITICGWTNQHWDFKEGEKVILVQENGVETCYEFVSIEHCGNPSDMYFADMKFTPRLEIVPTPKNAFQEALYRFFARNIKNDY